MASNYRIYLSDLGFHQNDEKLYHNQVNPWISNDNALKTISRLPLFFVILHGFSIFLFLNVDDK